MLCNVLKALTVPVSGIPPVHGERFDPFIGHLWLIARLPGLAKNTRMQNPCPKF